MPLILVGQGILANDDEYYEVEYFNKNKKELKKNVGYIKGNYVYIYRGKLHKNKNNLQPGIYKNDNKYIFVEPETKKEKEKYHYENVINLSFNYILSKIKENHNKFKTIEEIEVINNNSAIFVPTLKPTDDLLKRLIKLVIIEKGVNIKNFKDIFESPYALNNMKAALMKDDSPMTMPNFIRWAEILNIGIQITAIDGGEDTITPLKKPVIVEDQIFQKNKKEFINEKREQTKRIKKS